MCVHVCIQWLELMRDKTVNYFLHILAKSRDGCRRVVIDKHIYLILDWTKLMTIVQGNNGSNMNINTLHTSIM